MQRHASWLSLAVSTVALVAGLAAAPAAAGGATTTAASTASTAAASSAVDVDACNQNVGVGRFACLAVRRKDLGFTSQSRMRRATASSAAATPDGYSPSDLASAYNLPTKYGTGQRVYVVDAFNDPSAESDLAAYRTQYKLPACTTANGCFAKINQDGKTSPLPSNDTGWAGEIVLDLDMVSAACPKCAITLVEASSDYGDDLFDAVQEAASLGAKFVSMSWGGDEYSSQTSDDSTYFGASGVVYAAAAGDTGYGVEYPASSPNVVAVGGTSLTRTSSTSRGWRETVWDNDSDDATGSGCSGYEPKPTWEASVPDSVCTMRAETDVSADADPQTGVAVYQTYGGDGGGGWTVYGGTSAATPIIAATYALAGMPSTTVRPQDALWSNASALNDVTSGSNGTCSGQTAMCTAGPGWDGPTGLGTPNGITAFTTTTVTQQPGTYVPLPGSRILDTRSGTGTSSAHVLAAGSTLSLQVAGSGNVPATGASAVALNVTVVSPSANGYLTAYADGTDKPGTSDMDYMAARTQANLVLAPVGADGKVDLYVNRSTQLVADVSGYYVSGTVSDAGAYQPVAPARLLDTRDGTGGTHGLVPARRPVSLQVAGRGGVPGDGAASAVALSVAAVNPTRSGYLTVYPGGTALPTASSINYAAKQAVANTVVVPLGSDGTVTLYSSAPTYQLADVVGYYRATGATATGAFTSLTPARLLDTRSSGGTVAAGGTRSFTVLGKGGVPSSGVSAVAVNVAAVQPSAAGFVTAYAGGTGRPGTSNLNLTKGQTIANLVIVPVGANGKVTLYSYASTNLIADVAGYYSS